MSEFYRRLDINEDLWIPIEEHRASQENIDWANTMAEKLEKTGKGKLTIYTFGREGGQKVEGLMFNRLFGPTFFITDDFLAQIPKWGKVKFWPRIPVKEIINL